MEPMSVRVQRIWPRPGRTVWQALVVARSHERCGGVAAARVVLMVTFRVPRQSSHSSARHLARVQALRYLDIA